jgi:hypothetical protein
MKMSPWRTLPVLGALAVAVACGGSSTPTTPPTAAPSIAPTSLPSAAPSASPSGAASCRFGKGVVTTFCDRQTAAHATEVDAAITLLTQQRPDIFDLNQQAGEGGFKVLKPDDYYAGVIRNLEARDFCAGYDFVNLQLKNSNSFSESYDIMLGSGHIRRGAGAYRSTCSPPDFPLDPEDLIDHVRVGFFSIGCIPGVPVPRNGERLLLMGCYGYVTASPKDKNGDDIDARIHGSVIDWTLDQYEPVVTMDDFPNVAFNKIIQARRPGEFTVCATVKGVRGCLEGEVKDNALP